MKKAMQTLDRMIVELGKVQAALQEIKTQLAGSAEPTPIREGQQAFSDEDYNAVMGD